MADLDVDRARGVGVAVPPTSADEYHEGAAALQPGFVATADATEPGRGWTTQMRDAEGREDVGDGDRIAYTPPHDQLPGQVFTPDQLPDPQAAIAAGLPPVRVPEHLVVDDADHIQGPEPSEMAIREDRGRLRAKIVEYRDELAEEGRKLEERIRSAHDSGSSASASTKSSGGKQGSTNASNSGGSGSGSGSGSSS